MGQSPYAGLVFDQKGNLYGTTCRAEPTTAAAWDAASYSSSLQRARRQSSTASARRPTAPMGRIPTQGWSSTRRETCMGRPPAAAATHADRRRRIQAHSQRQGDSPLQLLCADQLRRWVRSRCRARLRPEGEPVWDDLQRRDLQQYALPLRAGMRRRIQAHSRRQVDSPLQLLCADQLRRWGESLSRAGLRPEGKPLWDGLRRGT